MTVVVCVKVWDGIVLAADSAATFSITNTKGDVVSAQVWNNADKVFHLHRDLPIGLACWGGGQIEEASISALAKDLRRRLMGKDPKFPSWSLDNDSYELSAVAENIVAFFWDELYSQSTDPPNPTGLLLAGYSANKRHPEVWNIEIADRTTRPAPELTMPMTFSGWRVQGEGIPIARLLKGIGPGLAEDLVAMAPEADKAAVQARIEAAEAQLVTPAMPFADAVELAKYLAMVTVGFLRFNPGPDSVGGPIDVAAISRYEGFKWVDRKHYYPSDLNPGRPHDHDK